MAWLLPVSISLSALMALYLASLTGQRRLAHLWLAAAFGTLAILHLMTGLVVQGQAGALQAARPVVAMGFPPLVFLHARALAHAARRPGLADLWHLTGPALVAAWQVFGMRWAPAYGWTLDLAVMISTLAYGCGVFAQTRRDLHPSARHWLRNVTLWLFALVLIDIVVALELAGDTPLSGSISLLAALIGLIGFLGYFLFSSLHRTGPIAWMAARLRTPVSDLAQRLDTHMREREVWRDPELTVARLARQIGSPQRAVSETINAHWRVSASRWINEYRISEAQALMAGKPDRPLVELMLDCGFQTRSNFNRAFKEIVGETPSAWRRNNKKNHPEGRP